MESFATTSSLIEAMASRSLAGDKPVTALYASAGPIHVEYTFLHPEFLSSHGLGDIQLPTYSCSSTTTKQPDAEFSDPATAIETLSREPVQASGIAMSFAGPLHERSVRRAGIRRLTIKADNRAVSRSGTADFGSRTSSSAFATAAARRQSAEPV